MTGMLIWNHLPQDTVLLELIHSDEVTLAIVQWQGYRYSVVIDTKSQEMVRVFSMDSDAPRYGFQEANH